MRISPIGPVFGDFSMKSKATRRFLESALRRVPPRTIATPWFRSWLRTCETLRITSDEALVSKYRHFRGREKFLAIMVLYHHRYRGAIPLLFRELRSPDALIGGAAGGALAMIGGQSVLVGLQKMLSEAAVCGLGASGWRLSAV